jgi:hypothetical protein
MGSGWARASRTAVLLLLVGDGLRASRGPRVLVQRAVHAARVLQRADIEPASASKHLLRARALRAPIPSLQETSRHAAVVPGTPLSGAPPGELLRWMCVGISPGGQDVTVGRAPRLHPVHRWAFGLHFAQESMRAMRACVPVGIGAISWVDEGNVSILLLELEFDGRVSELGLRCSRELRLRG